MFDWRWGHFKVRGLVGVLMLIGIGVPFSFAAEEGAYPQFVEAVFLTEQEALRKVFPKSGEVRRSEATLTDEQRRRVERRLGWRLEQTRFLVFQGVTEGAVDGYAMIMEEIGKFKPITFIVGVNPKGKVEVVEVMVYREPVGREVRRKRFLWQFKGKSAKSPLRINRDIINVTGATMSVRAMSAGVKRALSLLGEIYDLPR